MLIGLRSETDANRCGWASRGLLSTNIEFALSVLVRAALRYSSHVRSVVTVICVVCKQSLNLDRERRAWQSGCLLSAVVGWPPVTAFHMAAHQAAASALPS